MRSSAGRMGTQSHREGRVVLAGRPNVGKSTLFNRISGSRRAIVTPTPGTTRDVLRHAAEWLGTEFELVDTGGVFGASADPLQEEVAVQGAAALDAASVIVLVTDGRDGVVPADEQVAAHIRRSGHPVVLAVNKIDDRRAEARVEEFHRLAITPVVPIAAEHGLGVGDLLDAVVARLPRGRGARAVEADAAPAASGRRRAPGTADLAVAIIGRPNVGKSSLVNLLLREERVLVSEVAGTTRDAVDARFTWHGRGLRLVDTAGMRRPGRVARSGRIESVSLVMARRAVAEADVAVLVVDAAEGVARQDAAIAGEAERAGCGIVIAANKWDLVKDRGPNYSKQFDGDVRAALRFAEFAPILHISARTGERAPKLVERVVEVAASRARHVATGELNRFVERVTRRHPPVSPDRRNVRIKYAAQVGARPPTFVFFTNVATRFHFSYERYLRNRLRESFGFEGSPIRLRVRAGRDSREGARRR